MSQLLLYIHVNQKYKIMIIEKLRQKFSFVEQKDNMIIFKTFYKKGTIKHWYTIQEIENGVFRLTKGGIQKRDGRLDEIVDLCLQYID